MQKFLPVLLLVTVTYGSIQAQVGIGTSAPNTHAVLELKSPGNNQGLLAPALTTAQRTAPSLLSSLGSSENGLIVYDSDDQRFYFWKDTNWEAILSGAVSGVGTVLSVGTGTGLTGGPITSTGTISLANTTVSPGTYGSATQVSQFAVDAQGRITSASNVAISGVPPTGTAGGDLTGTFPNPGVASIRGNAVSATAPATNQILKWNGSAWTPAADANSGGTVTSVTSGTGLTGGPITGAGTISLANTAVTPATYGDATHVSQIAVDAQGRITSASSVTITGAAPTGAAGGDLTGNYPNPTITTNAVTAAKIAAGDYSTKINTGTYSISITGNAATATTATNFSGALVGDVTGTQGATSVRKLYGYAVSATAPTTNQILKWNGSSWLPSADANSGGTVTSVASGTGLTGGPITGSGTISLANTAVTPATYGDGTHVAQLAVDAQGRITTASSVLISGAPPTGAAGGDLTGTYPSPTITANAVTAAKIAAGDYSTKINTGTYSISITGNATTATTATNFSGALAGDVTGTQGASLVTKLQGSAVSATAPVTNQILKWNGSSWLPSADANSGGTVTSVATGTGLTGGPISAAGTISLANTTVVAGSYGSNATVPKITVDAQGRLTSASDIPITATLTLPFKQEIATSDTAIVIRNDGVVTGNVSGHPVYTGYGLSAITNNNSGASALYGEANGFSFGTIGIFYSFGYGVMGKNNFSTSYGYLGGGPGVGGVGTGSWAGVQGTSTSGYGVSGISTSGYGVSGNSSSGYGVYGTSSSSYAGYFNGNVYTVGTYQSSDQRFKKEIVSLQNCLASIRALRGVRFSWRSEEFPNRHFAKGQQIGFIAQEIEEVFPEMVNTDQDGYKSVEYTKVVPVLVEAIKEQQKMIDEQNAKIGKLENVEMELAALKAKVDAIEKAVANRNGSTQEPTNAQNKTKK